VRRVRALFDGIARLEGGAKQTIHYTAVAPAVVILAVTKGGNNIFNYVISEGKGEKRGLPVVNVHVIQEALEVFGDELLSPVYIGWAKGFHDDERTKLEQIERVQVSHPRRAFEALIKDLDEHPTWME
jgi:CRISPR-associated protein Cst2